MVSSRATQLRKYPSEAERALWQELRRRQLAGHRFRRQEPLGRYIVDFLCYEKRLVVEVDGGQHLERAAYDRDRTRWLGARGYRVLRFWNNEVLGQMEAVKTVILDALLSESPGHHPLLNPPPEGEEIESLPPAGEG